MFFSCNNHEQDKVINEKRDSIIVPGNIEFNETTDNSILNGYWVCTQSKSFIENSLKGDELEKSNQFKNIKVLYFEADSLFIGYQCGLKYSFSNTLSRGVFKHSYELDDYKKRLLDKFSIELKDSIGVIMNNQGISQSCEFLEQKVFIIKNKLIVEQDGILYLFEKNNKGYETILEGKNKLKFPITLDYLENGTLSNSYCLYNKELQNFGLCGDLEYYIVPSEDSEVGIFIFKSYCGEDFTYTLVTIKKSKCS
jgi:hypothetical protein